MQGMAKRLNAHLNKRLVSSLAKIPLSHMNMNKYRWPDGGMAQANTFFFNE
jgi:hypothetical protein